MAAGRCPVDLPFAGHKPLAPVAASQAQWGEMNDPAVSWNGDADAALLLHLLQPRRHEVYESADLGGKIFSARIYGM